ncbi:uncharacterized protein DNG_00120 [Cephalotrichum gorgonifer]|uniref:Sulfhydryl oxidase n=1 Tax=Cephalotrichum gorgonifer TaxID=2041049 RepID=A0AAE8MQ84_9PEZI|nr:uncharacterized protein DNG_00120 [Cephalotrichum gorgonifer]
MVQGSKADAYGGMGPGSSPTRSNSTATTPERASPECEECTSLASSARDRLVTCVAAYTSRRLTEEKAEIVDKLMHVFEIWLEAQLARFEEAFDDGDGGSPGEKGDSNSPLGRPDALAKRAGKKRGFDREDKDGKGPPGEEGGDGGEDRGGQSRVGGNKRTKVAHYKLACPYYKRDPEKFRNCRGCTGPGPGWDNFSRAKEHVVRKHAMPFLCVRCQAPFSSDEARRRHLREDTQCPVREEPGPRDLADGFDEDQLKKLKGRRGTNMTEADKWRDMYRVLFCVTDETDIPSPYYDQDEIFYTRVQKASAVIREELPPKIRKILDDEITIEMRGAEPRIVSRLVDVVYTFFERMSRPRNPDAPLSSTPSTSSAGPSRPDTPTPGTPAPVPVLQPTVEEHIDFNSAINMFMVNGLDQSMDFAGDAATYAGYEWNSDGWGEVISSDSSYTGSGAMSAGESAIGSLDTPVVSSRHSSPFSPNCALGSSMARKQHLSFLLIAAAFAILTTFYLLSGSDVARDVVTAPAAQSKPQSAAPASDAGVDAFKGEPIGKAEIEAIAPGALSGGSIAPKMENATAKAELGRATWKFLHTTMARFPENPAPDDSLALQTFVHLFARLYPCGECAAHFRKLLEKYPPQTSGRNAAVGWACFVHNEVNMRLEKDIFDCSKIGDFYDCGCGEEGKEGEAKEGEGKEGEEETEAKSADP